MNAYSSQPYTGSVAKGRGPGYTAADATRHQKMMSGEYQREASARAAAAKKQMEAEAAARAEEFAAREEAMWDERRKSEGGWGRPDQGQYYDQLIESGRTPVTAGVLTNAAFGYESKSRDRALSEYYWKLVQEGTAPGHAWALASAYAGHRPKDKKAALPSPGQAQPNYGSANT